MRRLKWAALALTAAATAFLLGPRPSADLAGEIPAVRERPTEAVKAWLTAQDAPAVTPGAEARVVWAGEEGRVTPWSVVYLHGFSATRQETAPLSSTVAATLGANLVEPRLRGHGRSGEALGAATAEQWMADTRAALALAQAIGQRTLVLACSTGATLATAVAVKDAPPHTAYVLLSPNFGVKAPSARLLLWPWAETWVPLVVGAERSWEPTNEAHDRYWTHRYPTKALFAMMALVDAVGATDLDRMRAPVRIFLDEEDNVVDPDATRIAFSRFESPDKAIIEVTGPGSHHVIAGDALSPARTGTIARAIVEFVRGL